VKIRRDRVRELEPQHLPLIARAVLHHPHALGLQHPVRADGGGEAGGAAADAKVVGLGGDQRDAVGGLEDL